MFTSSSAFIAKIFITVSYGLIVGILLNEFLFSQLLTLNRNCRVFAVCASSLLCMILCQFSVRFRCISALIWLEGVGSASRKIIKALVIMFVVVGPVNNLFLNVKEVIRVLECSAALTLALTITKIDLAVMPFINAFHAMDSQMVDVQSAFQDLSSIIAPIIHEVEKDFGDNRR